VHVREVESIAWNEEGVSKMKWLSNMFLHDENVYEYMGSLPTVKME
jgi:hypothetical protein